ncbi:DUF6261 family protein [Reichenbachiella ulvae]|uniref:DUF6261 family protein n=1 Tax=Reichenbachiella ulvae TaxID=2980104 RepID=A0ABT3CWA7_9BACT|nr:DUF6261 family protein [Reichenbachiella ulvae]MCV9387917.1 DUF6261 family protein [Reichenbachiella ulvae]
MSDVLTLVERKDPVAMKVDTAYTNLKTENDQLTQLLNPIKGSKLTAQMEAADDLRDQLLVGINSIVTGFTYHYEEELRRHAEVLLKHLDQFGGSGLARENYQSETAGINSMLLDWESESALSAAITELNLEGWKTKLQEANDDFSDLFLNRTEENSAGEVVSVREQRNKMRPLYYRLRDVIASYHTIENGAEPYHTVVKQLNALIDKYKRLLTSRQGKAVEELVGID